MNFFTISALNILIQFYFNREYLTTGSDSNISQSMINNLNNTIKQQTNMANLFRQKSSIDIQKIFDKPSQTFILVSPNGSSQIHITANKSVKIFNYGILLKEYNTGWKYANGLQVTDNYLGRPKEDSFGKNGLKTTSKVQKTKGGNFVTYVTVKGRILYEKIGNDYIPFYQTETQKKSILLSIDDKGNLMFSCDGQNSQLVLNDTSGSNYIRVPKGGYYPLYPVPKSEVITGVKVLQRFKCLGINMYILSNGQDYWLGANNMNDDKKSQQPIVMCVDDKYFGFIGQDGKNYTLITRQQYNADYSLLYLAQGDSKPFKALMFQHGKEYITYAI